MKRRIEWSRHILLGSLLLLTLGCQDELPNNPRSGKITFTFRSLDEATNGRNKQTGSPAYASFALKKPDGSLISDKVALYEFNGNYVSQPLQFDIGHYVLEQFLILDEASKTIYASPVAGSPLADLVNHPLPLSFDVKADEVTGIYPEVIALDDNTPEDFGYIAFGFDVIETIKMDVRVTIADELPHESVDYTLEIIAKDAPLGNIKWTKTINLSSVGSLQIPAHYAHYTFRAIKPGYLPHVQHFLTAELSAYDALAFEFIPENLYGFYTHAAANGAVKFYFPDDYHRCRLYTRIDLAEGYFLTHVITVKRATSDGGLPLAISRGATSNDCVPSPCYNRVNLYNNTPFATAADYCHEIDLPNGPTQTMNDVDISSIMTVEYYIMSPPVRFQSKYQMYKGANNW